MKRMLGVVSTALVLAAGGGVAAGTIDSPQATSDTASAAAAAATTTVPCGADINTYTARANAGDVLQLGACTYGDQTFTSRILVTVQGQDGTTVGDLDATGAANITFRDFTARDMFWKDSNGSASGGTAVANMTVDNVDFTAGGIFLRGCESCTFRNGESGNRHDAYSQTIGAYANSPISRNVLIENWRFHDMDRSANPGGHMECLFIQESDGVTVKNSLFERCSIMDVFISPIVGTNAPTNVSLIGNTFRTPNDRGGGAVLVNPDPATSTSGFFAQGNRWDDRFLLENDSGATVSQYVWCNDNTGAQPVLLGSTPGFVKQDCGASPPPPPTTTGTTTTAPTTTTAQTTTTTAPTTTAQTTTTTTTTPAPAYHPACEPTCDQEIAALEDKIARAKAALGP